MNSHRLLNVVFAANFDYKEQKNIIMKYKKGDKVRFLNAVGEGTVTKTTQDGTIFVLDETGFEVPAAEDELILINEGGDVQESGNTDSVPEDFIAQEYDFYPEGAFIQGNDKPQAFFALVPQADKDATDADLDTFLINDSNYILFYNLVAKTKHAAKGISAGIVEPNTKIELFTILKQEVGQSPDYIFQLTFYAEGEYTPALPIEKKIIISPIKLFKENTFKDNDFFHEKSLIFDLTAPEKPTIEEKKEAKEQQKKIKELEQMLNSKKIKDLKEDKKQERPRSKPKTEEKREIDLHINELMDNTVGLTNNEILEIQMTKFHEEMERAINDNLKRIVFIHGIGNGTLKNALRKKLSQQYAKYAFHDASFKEYGFGATLVVLSN